MKFKNQKVLSQNMVPIYIVKDYRQETLPQENIAHLSMGRFLSKWVLWDLKEWSVVYQCAQILKKQVKICTTVFAVFLYSQILHPYLRPVKGQPRWYN